MKLLLKSSVIGLCILLLLFSFVNVHGWFSVNKFVVITLTNINEEYYIDILIERDEAPILSDDELNSLLPNDYESTIFKSAMNGYRSPDGLVSFRLYSGESYQFIQLEENLYRFDYYSPTAANYRIAIIYLDGEMIISDSFNQSKMYGSVTYDLVTLTLIEDDIPSAIFDPPSLIFDSSEGYTGDLIWLIVIGLFGSLFVNLGIFFLFGYRRKKTFIFIGIAHISLTLIILGLMYINFLLNIEVFPFIAVFIIALAMFGEMMIAAGKLRELHPKKAIIYVMIANLFIFVVTTILQGYLFYS